MRERDVNRLEHLTRRPQSVKIAKHVEGVEMRYETEQINQAANPLMEALYSLDGHQDLSPLEALRVAHAVQFTARDVTPALVEHSRRQGASWQQIAEALGVTRSAAWQKYS